jgi:hypothetical protein
VSRQSQIILSVATSGSDATRAPYDALRFAISATATMMAAEMRVLIRKNKVSSLRSRRVGYFKS